MAYGYPKYRPPVRRGPVLQKQPSPGEQFAWNMANMASQLLMQKLQMGMRMKAEEQSRQRTKQAYYAKGGEFDQAQDAERRAERAKLEGLASNLVKFAPDMYPDQESAIGFLTLSGTDKELARRKYGMDKTTMDAQAKTAGEQQSLMAQLRSGIMGPYPGSEVSTRGMQRLGGMVEGDIPTGSTGITAADIFKNKYKPRFDANQDRRDAAADLAADEAERKATTDRNLKSLIMAPEGTPAYDMSEDEKLAFAQTATKSNMNEWTRRKPPRELTYNQELKKEGIEARVELERERNGGTYAAARKKVLANESVAEQQRVAAASDWYNSGKYPSFKDALEAYDSTVGGKRAAGTTRVRRPSAGELNSYLTSGMAAAGVPSLENYKIGKDDAAIGRLLATEKAKPGGEQKIVDSLFSHYVKNEAIWNSLGKDEAEREVAWGEIVKWWLHNHKITLPMLAEE